MLERRMLSFWARARHRLVLPVPGGPCSSTTLTAVSRRPRSSDTRPVPRLYRVAVARWDATHRFHVTTLKSTSACEKAIVEWI